MTPRGLAAEVSAGASDMARRTRAATIATSARAVSGGHLPGRTYDRPWACQWSIASHPTLPPIPGIKHFRGKDADERCFAHLENHHGIDRYTASVRLHSIKQRAGVGPAEDVVFGYTGDVYREATGEHLGMLSDPAA